MLFSWENLLYWKIFWVISGMTFLVMHCYMSINITVILLLMKWSLKSFGQLLHIHTEFGIWTEAWPWEVQRKRSYIYLDWLIVWKSPVISNLIQLVKSFSFNLIFEIKEHKHGTSKKGLWPCTACHLCVKGFYRDSMKQQVYSCLPHFLSPHPPSFLTSFFLLSYLFSKCLAIKYNQVQ